MNSTLEASTNFTSMPHSLLPVSRIDMFVHGINSLFGFPMHSYIIWLVVTGTRGGVASEFFNINLSICELCFSFNSLLIVLTNVVHGLSMLQVFLIGITITGRPLFQCLICVERYLAVIHPVTFLKFKPLRYRVICCTAVWIFSFGSCLCCMFTVAYNIHAFIWFFSLQFLLFLAVQLFCLVAVLRALKQSGSGERGRERKEETHMKRRVFYIILIITVSMVIIFVPFTFAGLFTIFTQLNTAHCRTFGFACFIMGGFVHPLLYLHRTGKLSCVCSP